jgi:hypothetical protein
LVVMLQDATIGEVNLKNTDEANHSCAMGGSICRMTM